MHWNCHLVPLLQDIRLKIKESIPMPEPSYWEGVSFVTSGGLLFETLVLAGKKL